MNRFEVVSKYITEDGKTNIQLPVRATKNSAGYDFFAAKEVVIPAYCNIMEEMGNYVAKRIPYGLEDLKRIAKSTGLRPSLIPTGVKCQLDPDKYLELSVRSSTPLYGWIVLANGVGIIDSDYYNNQGNEGEIFFQVINFSPVDIVIHEGDKIGQGIIKPYLLADNDIASGDRIGGFGSTSGN